MRVLAGDAAIEGLNIAGQSLCDYLPALALVWAYQSYVTPMGPMGSYGVL